MKSIQYNTRDSSGNDIVKEVAIKEYQETDVEFDCLFCGRHFTHGVPTKKVVSGNFTDWAEVGEYVCRDCSMLFSLYFYSYIVGPDDIRLLNVRQLRDALTQPQKTPFRFVITTSQKKHLFYDAPINHNAQNFAVKLERETISTSVGRMKMLFDFVECLLTLGCTKERLKSGEIFFPAAQKIGKEGFSFLGRELKQSREIQIPLYCGQKREITEEEALCCINLILTA